MNLDTLAPDLDRLRADFDELSGFTDPDAPGWSRRVFSEPYLASREFIRARMAEAGLEVDTDPAGNIIGRLPGLGPALVTGSHTDTVHGGGRFDGIVGVLGAIEVARVLRDRGVRLRHELRIVDFLGEEPNDHALSCVGSRAITGLLTPGLLDLPDETGRSLGAVMASAGLDPAAALGSAWSPGEIAAFVELHIEQGPVLERHGTEIGVVTAIAGIERLLATFTGRLDHAGTTPMDERRDALAAAAAAVLAVERVGCGGATVGAVATSGFVEATPAAVNVISERARVLAELRSVDASWLTGAKADLTGQIAAEASARGVEADFDWLTDQAPVHCTPRLHDVIARTAGEIGRSWRAMPSGAGHDAAHLERLGPMGMIFIPSQHGRSHCPEEFTDLTLIAAGVHTLAATLVGLDQ